MKQSEPQPLGCAFWIFIVAPLILLMLMTVFYFMTGWLPSYGWPPIRR